MPYHLATPAGEVNFTLMVDHGQALVLRTGRKQQHAGAPTGRRLVCLPVGHL